MPLNLSSIIEWAEHNLLLRMSLKHFIPYFYHLKCLCTDVDEPSTLFGCYSSVSIEDFLITVSLPVFIYIYSMSFVCFVFVYMYILFVCLVYKLMRRMSQINELNWIECKAVAWCGNVWLVKWLTMPVVWLLLLRVTVLIWSTIAV